MQQLRGAAYLQSGSPHLVDDGQNPKGQADTLLAAVLHQLKLAIRRHKADHLLGVEAPQVDTLVEGHILHSDTDRRYEPSSNNDNCSISLLACMADNCNVYQYALMYALSAVHADTHTVFQKHWAAWCIIRLLVELMPKVVVVFPCLVFSFLLQL